MKTKLFKTIIAAAFMIATFAIPVMAQEVTDPNAVIKEETFTSGEDALAQEFHNSEIWRCNNYLSYLDGVIYNLNEVVRIKQEIVNNYKWLSQYNPYYATLIPQAEKDVADAQAWVDYYKAYRVQVQADLKARYKF